MTEEKLRQAGDNREVSESLARQQALMILFDALILNKDRKPSDQLVTPEDGRLHLLDHSRSFQVSDEVPEAFLSRPVSLPRALLHRLVQLNTESLTELLDGLVTAAQVDAMLRRLGPEGRARAVLGLRILADAGAKRRDRADRRGAAGEVAQQSLLRTTVRSRG